MLKPGDIIPYIEMCREEGINLQHEINFKLKGNFYSGTDPV